MARLANLSYGSVCADALTMFAYSVFIGNRIENLWVYALIAVFGGLYLFYRGFRILQRKRLILNTPTSKIRSASLGLVEVSGLAVGPYTIVAPVTQRSCFYYRTRAWELTRSGKNEEWKQVADESLHVPFYLDDNTGKLLVNPQGAEMDLHRDFHEEYSNSIFFTHDIPDTVRTFLARHGVSGDRKIRVDEYCIKPKNALFILGTLAENIGMKVTASPVRSESAKPGFSFALRGPQATVDLSVSNTTPASTKPMFATVTHQEVIRLTPQDKGNAQAGTSQQAKIAAAMMKAGITNPAAWSAAGISDPATVIRDEGSTNTSATGAALAAESTGEPFDLQPKVVLMKGENDPTFLISWRSQKDLVTSLGWKSAACIWGGPALTLLGLYVLIVSMGSV